MSCSSQPRLEADSSPGPPPRGCRRPDGMAEAAVRTLIIELAQVEYGLRDPSIVGPQQRVLALRERAVVAELRSRGLAATPREAAAPSRPGARTSVGSASASNQGNHSQQDDGALLERIHHLERAVAGRTVIGQAQGILMERHRLSAEQAFEQLCAASQHLNRKLREVAADLAATGLEPPTSGQVVGRRTGNGVSDWW